jgi:hypothetical protein
MTKKTIIETPRGAKCCAAASLIGLGALLAGCLAVPEHPLAPQAPAAPGVLSGRFQAVIGPDFAEAVPVAGLALGRKVADYFAAEMRGAFEGQVVRRPGPADPRAVALDREFWRSAGAGTSSAVFLFGTAGLIEHAQKALKEADLPKDGPFKLDGHGLAERKLFVLTIDLALIETATGAVIWKEAIKETWVSSYIQQAAEFALTELLPMVKTRLFSVLFTPGRFDRRPAAGS